MILQALVRHYEDLGLVIPERVDSETGYRYYGSRQFEILNTIRYLRALDMPLPEIADFLHLVSPRGQHLRDGISQGSVVFD